MLDDLKLIHQRDKSDALGIAEKQWQQLQQNYEAQIESAFEPQHVVVAGMGGSALAATYITTWPELNIPFQVVRGYDIPRYVNKSTLFIASSYSGNTEETLSAIDKAESQGAFIVVISAGGKLKKIAEEKNYPYYQLPSDFQPRMAVFYNFAALIDLFVKTKLIDKECKDKLRKVGDFIKSEVGSWRPDVATKNNQAKQIALELAGKSPVFYGGPEMFPAAYKWKINCNENAKHIAWCNQLPEFNHNEFLGWSEQPQDKPYAPVFLRSSYDHSQVSRRFEVSAKLLSGKMPHPITVQAKGRTILEQLVWSIVLGDFVSLYLALVNNLDPSPVVLIEKLKKELA